MEIFLNGLGFLKGTIGVLLFIVSALCLSGSLCLRLYLKRQQDKLDKRAEIVKDAASSPNPIRWGTAAVQAIASESPSIDPEQMENLASVVYIALGVGIFTMLLSLLLLLVF